MGQNHKGVERDTLIELRRRYTDHEVISALYKRLAEKDKEIGQLTSYVQELEYRERQVKNLDNQLKRTKDLYRDLVLDVKKTEPYKELQEVIDKLRKDRP